MVFARATSFIRTHSDWMLRGIKDRRATLGSGSRGLGGPCGSLRRKPGRSLSQRRTSPFKGTLIGAQVALLALYTIITRSDAMGDIEFVVRSVQHASC